MRPPAVHTQLVYGRAGGGGSGRPGSAIAIHCVGTGSGRADGGGQPPLLLLRVWQRAGSRCSDDDRHPMKYAPAHERQQLATRSRTPPGMPPMAALVLNTSLERD